MPNDKWGGMTTAAEKSQPGAGWPTKSSVGELANKSKKEYQFYRTLVNSNILKMTNVMGRYIVGLE